MIELATLPKTNKCITLQGNVRLSFSILLFPSVLFSFPLQKLPETSTHPKTTEKKHFTKPWYCRKPFLLPNSSAGDPLDEQTDLGPLISARQLARVEEQVQRAVGAGARALVGGKRAQEEELQKGHFYEATVARRLLDVVGGWLMGWLVDEFEVFF